jgi:hypothetical protein
MDYYLKYIKYKNKYLELKGGYIPSIDDINLKTKYFPLKHSSYTITFNNKVIKYGDTKIYNLNSNFMYEKNNNIKPNIITFDDYEKNYDIFFNDEIVINEQNKIPFDLLLLDSNFNINNKLQKLLSNILCKKQILFIKDAFTKYSNIYDKDNILNKYIFINKFRELLEILYSDSDSNEFIKNKIIEIHDSNQAFINISDMMKIYSIIDIKNDIKNDDISNITNINKNNKYNNYINNEITLIKELRTFINKFDIIDNIDGLKDFLGIKTSLIFFANFIGNHYNNNLYTTKIINFFPINADNLICNLLKLSNDDLENKYKGEYTNEYKNFPTYEHLYDKSMMQSDDNIIELENLLNYKYKNIIFLLSSKYYIHSITNFNIFKYYLKDYTGTNNILPFYLKFLLFDKKLNSEIYLNKKIANDINENEKIFNSLKVEDLKDIIFNLQLYKYFIKKIQNSCIIDDIDNIKLFLSYLKLFDLNMLFTIEITDKLLLQLEYTELYTDLYNKYKNKKIYFKLPIDDYILCKLLLFDLEFLNKNYYKNVCIIIHDLLEHYNNSNKILDDTKRFNIYDNKNNKIGDCNLSINIVKSLGNLKYSIS